MSDAEKITFKMRLITLMSLIGGTISICITVAIYVGGLENRMTRTNDKVEEHTVQISTISQRCDRIEGRELNARR